MYIRHLLDTLEVVNKPSEPNEDQPSGQRLSGFGDSDLKHDMMKV